MKRTVLFLAALMTVSLSWAQLNKSEVKNLTSFLSQTAANGETNAAALGIGVKNITAAPGLKVENGHIVEIDWSH